MYKLLFFLLFSVQTLSGQNDCKINNLRFDYTSCNEEGKFYVYLHFDHQFTTNTFLLLGNGHIYGTFLYTQLPLKIGPLSADCVTDYEFLVKDNVLTECQAYVKVGKKCCSSDCKMYVDSVTATCHNATMDIRVFASRPSKNEGKFKLKVNNQLLGTFDLGVGAQVNALVIDPLEPIMEIVTCLVDTENCCDTFYYVNPCFCSITQFKTQIVECSEDAGRFSVKIDFTGTATSDSFIIGGNGTTYGTFSYNQLPITISNLPFDSTKNYEFLVLDKNSSFCFGVYELGVVESCRFECSIKKPTMEILPCNEDGKFYARLQFKEENTSHAGFRVRGNGVVFGTYTYGEHYYDIGPLNADCHTRYEFIVRDIEMESCQNHVVLEEPVCCQDSCYIREVSITENCVDGELVSYTIDFDHNQDSLKIFGLWANGVKLGNYHFGALPLTIHNPDFDLKTVNFLIVHLGNEHCRKEFTYTFECNSGGGDCKITIVGKERGECTEDGQFYVFFSIRSENPGAHGFKVTSPQTNYIAQFEYGHNSYKIGPFKGDCVTKYSFIIQDHDKPDCKVDFGLETPVCCDQDCFIKEVTITEICEGDNLKGYKVNFIHNQESSKYFALWANGVKVGEFTFSQLPITINNPQFNTHLVVFKIIVLHNEACRKEITHEFDCTTGGGNNCSLLVENMERGECNDDGGFYLFFKLKATNTGNLGFKVLGVNGIQVQTFAYGQASYKIGPFIGDCVTKYRFVIKDIAHPDCATEFGLLEPVCCSQDCFIKEVTITEICEGDNLKGYKVNFIHNQDGTKYFGLWANGVKVGEFTFSQLPITINNPQFNTHLVVFKIIVLHNEACRKEITHEFDCTTGGGNNCSLLVENMERGECNDDGGFYLFFKLKATNTGNLGFKVLGVNGIQVQTFAYGQASYKIGPFIGDCVTKYRFVIKDIAHPDCATEFGLLEPVCCSEGCAINSLDIEKTECINGLVAIRINFEHHQTSGSFTLKVNGQVRGTYQYQDLPIIIRNLEPKKVYHLFIKDNEKECGGEFNITTPECSVSAEEVAINQAKVFRVGDDIMVTLRNPEHETTGVLITDILGRQYFTTTFSGSEVQIPVPGMPSGVYLVTLQSGLTRKTFKVFWSR